MQLTLPIIILGALCLILLLWAFFLQMDLNKIKRNQSLMFSGAKGKDLESIIVNSSEKVKKVEKEVADLYAITNRVHDLANRGIHQVGMVRFNPFRDIGGDQSFALALLDGQNNGITLSSLYSREGVRVYCKSIENGSAIKHQLTDEEKRAIEIALVKKK